MRFAICVGDVDLDGDLDHLACDCVGDLDLDGDRDAPALEPAALEPAASALDGDLALSLRDAPALEPAALEPAASAHTGIEASW